MEFLSKILSFVLIAHLLVATSGPPLIYNFCGETLVSITVGVAEQEDCSIEDVECDKSNCCEQDYCHIEVHISEFHPEYTFGQSQFNSFELSAPLFHSATLVSSVLPRDNRIPIRVISPVEYFPRRHGDIPILFRSLLI